MKTEVTIPTFSRKAGIGSVINDKRRNMLRVLADLYSTLLEEKVTPGKAARIVNAQLAFVALILCGACSLLCSAMCTAWLVVALLRCRQS